MGIISNLGRMDQDKAAKYVGIGILLAIIFGSAIMVSKSLYDNATAWQDDADNKALLERNLGIISEAEYQIRQIENEKAYYLMRLQALYVTNIGKIGVNIGLFLVFIGFVGLGINGSGDEKTRRLFLTIAAIVIFVMMFTTFFSGISITLV